MDPEPEHFVFVAFNSRVAALDRRSGEIAWSWKSPKGYGFVALLHDGDLLYASVQGYTYALDPHSGEQLWNNDMPGFGLGVPCIATARGHSGHPPLGEEAATEQSAATGMI